MKRLPYSAVVQLLCACALAVLLAACSAIKEGRVVRKGIEPTGTPLHPGPIHWIDVRGENYEQRVVTVRMEFFEMDWKAIKKGDWIAPASYGLPRFFERIHAYNEEQRRESGSFGSTRTASHAEPKAKAGAKGKKVARRKPAAPRAPSPAPEEPAVATTPEPTTPPAAPAAEEREAKYRAVREKAIEDESLRALKKKIHAAGSDEEQARTWREYRSALRDKMHALDPSLGDLIDRADESAPAASQAPTPPR